MPGDHAKAGGATVRTTWLILEIKRITHSNMNNLLPNIVISLHSPVPSGELYIDRHPLSMYCDILTSLLYQARSIEGYSRYHIKT